MRKICLLGLLILGSTFITMAQSSAEWISLFNGKDLSGWEKKKGEAEYKVDGNEIIGISKLGSPSTYLCTQKEYSDFISR